MKFIKKNQNCALIFTQSQKSDKVYFSLRILVENVIPCIVSDTLAQHGRTCTEKEQHNIIVTYRTDIQGIVGVDPMKCKFCQSHKISRSNTPITCTKYNQTHFGDIVQKALLY